MDTASKFKQQLAKLTKSWLTVLANALTDNQLFKDTANKFNKQLAKMDKL
jgi:hypothetical protein